MHRARSLNFHVTALDFFEHGFDVAGGEFMADGFAYRLKLLAAMRQAVRLNIMSSALRNHFSSDILGIGTQEA